MEITARVVLPATVTIEISDEESEKILNHDFDTIEAIRERLKEQAEFVFESSAINSIIHDCSLDPIIE